ncbi:MAG: cupin domain-containing protein [Acidimicrobiia bacterium]|nr:cupin domain-containing protein [Acidimicrobiia bacterium]
MKRRNFIHNTTISTFGVFSFNHLFNLKNDLIMNHLPAYKRNLNPNNVRALKGGGVIITFLATSKDTNGLYTMFEAKGIAGMEPPPHIHANEDETYYILDGEFYFKVGEEEFNAKPGDFVFLPRNVKHEFKVLSETFHCQVGLFPAGIDEMFLAMSDPHDSLEIPPIDTTPSSPEIMEQMMKLNQKFGISY